jgi:hypothetical protein
LVWFGLVWFGLVWFGLVWFGLVWFVGMIRIGWMGAGNPKNGYMDVRNIKKLFFPNRFLDF